MATGKQPAESAPATAALDQPGSGAEISDCQRYRYALWRRWAFDADGEPFERELAIRGDIDDAPGVGGYGSPRDTA